MVEKGTMSESEQNITVPTIEKLIHELSDLADRVVGYKSVVGYTVFVSYYLDENVPKPLVLLAKRKNSPHYTFPGGKANPSEGPLMAAFRETMEETGINIALYLLQMKSIRPCLLFVNKVKYELYGYLVFLPKPITELTCVESKEPDKHEGWEWVDLPMLLSLAVQNRVPPQVLLTGMLKQISSYYAELINPDNYAHHDVFLIK